MKGVRDLMNMREKFLNKPEPEEAQPQDTNQEHVEAHHTERSTKDPVLSPVTQKAERIDEHEKANTSMGASVPIETSDSHAGVEIKADRLSVDKPQVLLSATAMNEEKITGDQTSGLNRIGDQDFRDADNKLADDSSGLPSNRTSPSTQNENIAEDISLVDTDRSHALAQAPVGVVGAVPLTPRRPRSQASGAPREVADSPDESGLPTKQTIIEDDEIGKAEPEELPVDSRDAEGGEDLGDDDVVLDEPAAQVPESDEFDEDLPLESALKPATPKEIPEEHPSSIADPVQPPPAMQDQETTPGDSPAPSSPEKNTTPPVRASVDKDESYFDEQEEDRRAEAIVKELEMELVKKSGLDTEALHSYVNQEPQMSPTPAEATHFINLNSDQIVPLDGPEGMASPSPMPKPGVTFAPGVKGGDVKRVPTTTNKTCADCKKLRAELEELKARNAKLRSAVAKRDASIVRLRGNKVPTPEPLLEQEIDRLRLTCEYLYQKLDDAEKH